MAEEIGPRTLYPKKSTAVWLLLLCSAFVVAGLFVGKREGWIAYAGAGFFALGIPVAIVQLLPGSSYLRIDAKGITFRNMFRDTSVLWSDVEEFFVVTMTQKGIPVRKMVGLNYVPSYDRMRLGRRLAAAIANCEGALPDTYGKRAEELATLLNSCLQIATGRGEKPGPKFGS
jgi:hypothetical protein